jgi:ferredoxin-NADP reductase
MLAKKYHSRVKSVLNPIEGIYTLEFESLEGRFKYNPGQFLHLSIDQEYDGTGQWPESRCFSMQSNPDEGTLKITFSVKGKFTLAMKEQLKIGSLLWLKLPYGSLFSQEHNKVNTVFIAGGTGITPFLSLFTHSLFTQYLNSSIYLGFRNKAVNIYSDDLEKVKEHIKKIYYEDIDGFINIDQILLENQEACDFFISGPPSMIASFRDKLEKSKVSPLRIFTDDWE